MGSLVQRNKEIAKKKGRMTAVAAGASVVAAVALSSPLVCILGLSGAAYLGYDWFKFRAKNGMRF